jgi:hypothetical protein
MALSSISDSQGRAEERERQPRNDRLVYWLAATSIHLLQLILSWRELAPLASQSHRHSRRELFCSMILLYAGISPWHAQTASEVATSLVSLYPLQTRLLSIFNQGMGLCLESDMCRSICLRFRINLQVHNCISTPCQMLVQTAEGASDPHKLILRN